MTFEEVHSVIELWYVFLSRSNGKAPTIEAFQKALFATDLQIGLKPENHSGRYSDNLCPRCGKQIKSGQGSSSRERTNWCNHCGQKIKWGD